MSSKRRAKPQPEGAPEWMVTYGDMMTLLLCFFVLLAAFSELKKDQKVKEVMRAVKEAFGYSGGAGVIPTDEMPDLSIQQIIDEIALRKHQYRHQSNTNDPSIYGRETTVQNIREGMKFIVGGMLTFAPGSAELKPEGIAEIRKLSEVIRGKNNMLEIRGHAWGADLLEDSQYKDLWELSYARAKVVERILTTGEKPINSKRIRLVGCSDNEPLKPRVYNTADMAVNRRVEIVVTETLMQEVAREMTDDQLTTVTPRGEYDGQ